VNNNAPKTRRTRSRIWSAKGIAPTPANGCFPPVRAAIGQILAFRSTGRPAWATATDLQTGPPMGRNTQRRCVRFQEI